MALSVSLKDIKPSLDSKTKQILYEIWQKDAPKLMFGEHQLCVEMNEIGEFFVEKARKELRETPEVVAQGFKELKELLSEEPDMNVPTDVEDYLLTFLRPCKWYAKSAFSLEESLPEWSRLRLNPKYTRSVLLLAAFNTVLDNNNKSFEHFIQQLKRYYQYRLNYANVYKDLTITKDKTAICAGVIYPLPLRTFEGCRVMVVEGGKHWNPKQVSTHEFFKGVVLILFLAFLEYRTQIAGVHIILDVGGLSLSHITYLTPSFAKMMVDFIQKSMPTRLKGIHIVNQSRIFSIAFAIFKPFLEEKVRSRIHIHGTNWESLMAFVDKKALLQRHGGEIKMAEEQYGVTLWQNMLCCEPAFLAELQCGFKTDKQ